MEYGKENISLIEKIKKNIKFQEFVRPMSDLKIIRDANFFIRNDGICVFSEGYFHPKGKLIGNIIYIPIEKKEKGAANKEIFGHPYKSIIKKMDNEGEEAWIPFQEQLEEYAKIDSRLQAQNKPAYAEYKLVFELDDFIGFADPLHSMKIIRKNSPRIDKEMKELAELLNISVNDIGCTGSLALGNFEDPHDFDLIFYGTAEQNRKTVDRIYELTKEKEREVWEYGVKWAIRFYDNNKNMICSFFSYTDTKEIPLKDFEMDIIKEKVTLTSNVKNDIHTGYLPTFLPLENIESRDNVPEKDLTLLIYNGGLRGEYVTGDKLEITGKLVNVKTKEKEFPAILVIDLDQTKKI